MARPRPLLAHLASAGSLAAAGPLVAASVAHQWPPSPQMTRTRPLVSVWPLQGLWLCKAAGYCQRRTSLATKPTDDALQALCLSGRCKVSGCAGPLVSAIVAPHRRRSTGHQAQCGRSATQATPYWPPGLIAAQRLTSDALQANCAVDAKRLTGDAPLATRLNGRETPLATVSMEAKRLTSDAPLATRLSGGEAPHRRIPRTACSRSTGIEAKLWQGRWCAVSFV